MNGGGPGGGRRSADSAESRPADNRQQAELCRDLARRARRLAQQLPEADDVRRLRRHADELEDHARMLETRAAPAAGQCRLG
jgi:hypothetical protein